MLVQRSAISLASVSSRSVSRAGSFGQGLAVVQCPAAFLLRCTQSKDAPDSIGMGPFLRCFQQRFQIPEIFCKGDDKAVRGGLRQSLLEQAETFVLSAQPGIGCRHLDRRCRATRS